MTKEDWNLKIESWDGSYPLTLLNPNKEDDFNEIYQENEYLNFISIGNESLVELQCFRNYKKDIYIVELCFGSGDLQMFFCSGSKNFLDCYSYFLDICLKKITFLKEIKEWEK